MSNEQLHSHHIVPKHAGGANDSSNRIMLTVVDHAEAHRLLWEQYGQQEDWLAWQGLTGLIGKDDIVRNLMKKGFRGRKHSAETKRKMSATLKGHSTSLATRAKQRLASLGNKNAAGHTHVGRNQYSTSLGAGQNQTGSRYTQQ